MKHEFCTKQVKDIKHLLEYENEYAYVNTLIHKYVKQNKVFDNHSKNRVSVSIHK